MQPNLVLPAEWAPQSAVMLTWPHEDSDWKPWLHDADRNFAALATQISRRQNVIIACYDESHRRHVHGLLHSGGAVLQFVRLYTAPSNDTWARDHGPITVYQDGQPVLLDFHFNGWGGKFDYALDNQITRRLQQAGAFGDTPLRTVDLILEGGSIESDGAGTVLTTRRCLLAANRNALEQNVLEARLTELLGVERFLWLSEGDLLGDDTDGHIDTLARFCDTKTIAYQACEDLSDPHFAPLKAMEQELRDFRTATGKPYRLVPLPLPRPIADEDGHRLPAGYVNFLIINEAVLVPVYDDPADAQALARLQGCFPKREVIGIDCRTLVRQYGSLHCVTMQLPVGITV
jgi:agmatine deiminase